MTSPIYRILIFCFCIFFLALFFIWNIDNINSYENDDGDSSISTTGAVVLDPVYAVYCAEAKKRPSIKNSSVPLPVLREEADRGAKKMIKYLPEVIEEDKTIVYNNTEVRLTLIRPPGTESKTLPIVLYYHGGGWIFGSKFTHAKPFRDICVKTGAVVVFIDYSLAPESTYPTAHEESFAALAWVAENGHSIQVDTNKLAVAGDSAGGNLAAAVSLMAKERGFADLIKAQIMMYPAVAATRDDYKSAKLFGNGDYALRAEDCDYFLEAYYNDNKETKIGFPLLATQDELTGLPPALLFTAEADMLRDEGEHYARRLAEAGVPTAAVRVIGAIHGYATVPADTFAYKQTMAIIANFLSEVF